jgi:iron complex outermembrane receptor protein
MGFKSCLLAGAMSVAGAWAAPQLALADQASASAADSSPSVAEVVVTAERREEPIEKVPVSVTAVGGAQVEQLHIHDLADLNHIAPNFSIEGSGALFRNAAVVFARGIGYDNVDATLDPRIGVSVDGVFYLRNVGVLQDMFDISDVEILLGPQGSLFGKNTAGGAINITTQRPKTSEYEADGMLRFGNFGRFDAEAVGNLPISDNLALRVAFQSQYSEGPYTNTYTGAPTVPLPGAPGPGKRLGGDNTQTVRASLLWTPTPRLEFDLIGTYLDNHSPSVGGTNASSPTDLLSLILGHPGYGYPGGPTSPFQTARSWPSADDFNMADFTLISKYHGEGYDIISTTAYVSDNNPTDYNDFSNAGINFFETYSSIKHNQFSEESRIESNGSGPWKWVAGVYYDQSYYYYYSNIWPYFLGFFGEPGILESQLTLQHEHSVAGFGQVTYQLTPKLSLTAGGRVLSETKTFLDYPAVIGAAPIYNFPSSDALAAGRTWRAGTYNLAANYQFTPDAMAYVSFSTGFKSGGFNSGAASTENLGPFEPENTSAWEVGLKSQWFDRRLIVNLAGFWNNYEHLQEETYVPSPIGSTLLTAIGNDGYELARGIETQITALPTPDLRLNASIGYLDAHYTRFHTDLFGTGTPGNFAFLRPEHSPMWTARFEGSYDFHTAMGRITPDVVWSYQTSYFTDLSNSPQGYNPAYGLLDANLAWTDPSGRYIVSLFGKNLTNKLYTLNAVPVAGLFTPVYFGMPRTFGIELRVKLERPR